MSEYKIKLKIGEFSKMCRVSVKTLRHYEKIGLLSPHEVDQWTGYRYYEVEQMGKMNRIHLLKELGFNLESIKELFENGQDLPDLNQIKTQLEESKSELQRIQRRIVELDKLRKQATKQEKMENIHIKSLPAAIVASYRKHVKSYQELFDLCPNVICPEMQKAGYVCPKETEYCFTIDHNNNFDENDIDLEYCEVVAARCPETENLKFKEIPFIETAICFNHYGSYNNLPQSFEKLFAYLQENGYEIIDDPRFCYIDGIWNKESEDEWLTEIQVPAKKK
ncbi:MAG TPA: MerR family transcriptional regulator [Paludibacteraceae bacterium]|nr:MerR family transcriptional regulator [Paludibacteraceae bacterium]HQF49288.1 MerR family transcriptional regulator [Paludibacteraceae bacterium]HQJ89732.1 MerR family transcriptional regulator [Paludibacteraceae bacterium]